MKSSSWLPGGVALAVVVGLVYVAVGLLRPGSFVLEEVSGGGGPPLLIEAKKKSETVQKSREKTRLAAHEFTGFKGLDGEHRVFVSAQLVFLPDSSEPVQPLDRKMMTKDGIEVGWKIQNGLDPADPQVKDEDPDGDGFTNLEEFLAKTNPTNKEDSPAKESKLKSRSGEPVPMVVSFPEKGGGIYSIRFQVGNKRREFKGKPGDSFWVMAGPETLEVFSDEAKMKSVQTKAKESGQNSHVIPLKFVSYEEKLEKMKDVKAGGVEVEVDNSVIVVDRKDALEESQKLVFSTPQRPQTLSWDVGEIRLFTPTGGGAELGPFRLGETFPFEGKEFSVVGREGKKIQLRNRREPDKQLIWVPVESAAPPLPGPVP